MDEQHQVEFSNILVGGSLWLNLANTIFLHDLQQVDILRCEGSTLQWLQACELVDSVGQEGECIPRLAAELRDLRNIIYDWLDSIHSLRQVHQSMLQQLHVYFQRFELAIQLEMENTKPKLIYACADPVDTILYKIALSIVTTLQEVPLDRIRQCEHETCVLYFLDTSKGGRRRWCSMDTCGNRKKASTFYSRKKEKT